MSNVKCYEDVDIPFTTGKNVIIGRNGSGKSTILQSILYSMFSETTTDTKDQMVRTNQSAADFELYFEHQGREYQIERKLRASGSPSAYLKDLVLDEDKAETQTGVDKEVASILQISKEVFRDVVMVQQGEIAEIIDMTAGKRKKLFDKLLGIHEYEQAFEKCARIKSTLQNKQDQYSKVDGAYRETAGKLDERKEALDEAKESLKKKKQELTEVKKSLKKFEPEYEYLEELDKKIGILKAKIEQQQESLSREHGLLEKKHEEIKKYIDELSIKTPKKRDLESYESIQKEAEEQGKVTQSKLDEAREKKTTLLAQKQQLETSEKHLGKLQEELTKLKLEIDKSSSSILAIIPRLEKIHEKIWPSEIEKEITEKSTKNASLEEELEKAEQLNTRLKENEIKAGGFNREISKSLTKCKKNARKAKADLGDSWIDLAETDLRGISPKISSLASNIEEKDSELHRIQKEITRQQTIVESIEKQIADLSKAIGKKCPKCKQIIDEKHANRLEKEFKEKLSNIGEIIVSLENQESTIEKELIESKKELEKLKKKKEKVLQARDYHEIDSSLKDELDEYRTELENIEVKMETISGELKEFDLETLEKMHNELLSDIAALKECKNPAERIVTDKAQAKKKVEEITKLEEEISGLKSIEIGQKIEEESLEIDNLASKTNVWKNLSKSLSDAIEITKNLEGMEENHDRDKIELEGIVSEYDTQRHSVLKTEVGDLKEKRAGLEERVKALSEDIIPSRKNDYNESKNALDQIKEIEADEERVTKALEILGTIRQFYREIQRPLRRRDIHRASKHASEIFKTLMGSNEFDRIRITDDHDLLISRVGEFEPMSRLSGGEQVLAGLSVRLGFARALASSDLLILDEPTAFLDDQRRAELVETLNRVSPAKQIIIVTHDDEFERIAQRVLYVEKDEYTLSSSVTWSE